jgi:hypothetical protein
MGAFCVCVVRVCVCVWWFVLNPFKIKPIEIANLFFFCSLWSKSPALQNPYLEPRYSSLRFALASAWIRSVSLWPRSKFSSRSWGPDSVVASTDFRLACALTSAVFRSDSLFRRSNFSSRSRLGCLILLYVVTAGSIFLRDQPFIELSPTAWSMLLAAISFSLSLCPQSNCCVRQETVWQQLNNHSRAPRKVFTVVKLHLWQRNRRESGAKRDREENLICRRNNALARQSTSEKLGARENWIHGTKERNRALESVKKTELAKMEWQHNPKLTLFCLRWGDNFRSLCDETVLKELFRKKFGLRQTSPSDFRRGKTCVWKTPQLTRTGNHPKMLNPRSFASHCTHAKCEISNCDKVGGGGPDQEWLCPPT